jgi:DNA mismatch repair protein MutL
MIRILPPEEAKKIAAGEVIDRPAALVREFIDNALDSGALNIELSIEQGGIGKVEVIDDGSGMNRDDLSLCVKTHATSKIQTLDDLSRATTLGFRGEALAAAAAVARLEIITSGGGKEAWLLEAANGEETITQTRRVKGTSVRASRLFESIPARKRFLKRESAEAALCRQTFIEKALAFPGVTFRFTQDSSLKLNLLPSPGDPLKRFGELFFTAAERNFLHAVTTEGKGFTVTVIFGGPELYRMDRRHQYIFANKRRIHDWALSQAFEYGLSGFFPNNSHPVGAVFIDVDPALADFNIHPAKREIRFADSASIHHAITSALRDHARKAAFSVGGALAAEAAEAADYAGQQEFALPGEIPYMAPYPPAPKRMEPAVAESKPVFKTAGNIRFIGRALGLFIIVEKNNRLFLIDQHAAHERLLYNRYSSAPITAQELLVAIPFSTSGAEEENFLIQKQDELAKLGIVIKKDDEDDDGGALGGWRIEALPAGWKSNDGETIQEILSLGADTDNLTRRWAASLACRNAIKDGDWLDDACAYELAEAVLALEDETGRLPRCPHGRPLWKELSREELFKAVRRVE